MFAAGGWAGYSWREGWFTAGCKGGLQLEGVVVATGGKGGCK